MKPHPPRVRRGGFSLVETTIAVVLVGGVYVVALNLVGASAVTQQRYSDRELGLILAEQLLAEALEMPYLDAEDGGATLGLDAGEAGDERDDFDDVDDYHGWSATPPVDADGDVLAGMERFTRSAEVVWVELANPKAVAAAETTLKRVTVRVRVGDKAVAELVGYHARVWPTAGNLGDPLR